MAAGRAISSCPRPGVNTSRAGGGSGACGVVIVAAVGLMKVEVGVCMGEFICGFFLRCLLWIQGIGMI